ncbi:MAG: Ribose import ATP-binding protein RbsA [Gemmatimonadaceae bacterium]|nr:Ribose import ATP-binding protein RbsA [Gemmatimonadaceae bacterium]
MSDRLLDLRNVQKRFGSVVALDGVSLQVASGSVHALLGENGAGKTTLMRIAYGLTRPDLGRIGVGGTWRHFRSPMDALDAGVGMVQQHFSLVPSMTVAENVVLGTRLPFRPTVIRRIVLELAEKTGLPVDPDARVETLSIGAQQRVEILKVLVRDARVLILDEPTAVLPPQQGRELLSWVRNFCTEDRAVVLITHKLEDVRAVADAVTVLRGGRCILTGKTYDIPDDTLVGAMLGAPLEPVERVVRHAPSGPPILQAKDVTLRDARGIVRIRNADFSVRAGEVIGVAGVEGSGHRELLRAVAGRLKPFSGSLVLPQRVGYVPEDRQNDALLASLDLRQNLLLHDAARRRGFLRWKSVERSAESLISAFDIHASGPRAAVDTLSGGNQQRFVLAREISDRPDLLVAANPTRGLDVRAAQYVLELLGKLRDDGMAVIIQSNDIDELLETCDRILVTHAGRVREARPDRDLIGRIMVGAA